MRTLEVACLVLAGVFGLLCAVVFRLFEERDIEMRQDVRVLLHTDGLVEVGFLVAHVEHGILDIVELFDDFEEDCFRVVVFVSDEDICHAMSDELEGLHVVFVFIERRNIVFKVDFWPASLLLHLLKEEIDVPVGPLFDFVGNVDIRDEGPGDEEVREEFFEDLLGDEALFGRHYHFEGYFGLVGVVVPPQDVHILQEILEADLTSIETTLPSLSRSKALNNRSENYCEQCRPRMPMFFLNISGVMYSRLFETFRKLTKLIGTV